MVSLPSNYNLVRDAFWPINLMMAVFVAHLLHEWCGFKIFGGKDDDDEPDCPA